MTPVFLKLAKIGPSENTIDEICDENGLQFPNSTARYRHIHKFYKNLYKKTDNNNHAQTIEDFLGPDILAKDHVRNAKIPENKRLSFETDLTLQELDKAIATCKPNTAPGIDGISYAFLKKFWPYFRVPLMKCASYSFENGTLTHSFKTAAIKLIPKKGDVSNIKNWRPISLLNCSYKIISRALNNRLKQVSDYIMSRAQ